MLLRSEHAGLHHGGQTGPLGGREIKKSGRVVRMTTRAGVMQLRHCILHLVLDVDRHTTCAYCGWVGGCITSDMPL